MKRPLIAPSLLAADFSRMGDELRSVEKAGADVIHIDIMDGHFVPNLTMGPELVKSLRPHTKLPFDVHLMLERPERFIEPFAKAGADWLSIHVETCDLHKLLSAIKKLGCKAGAVVNPPTPVEELFPFLEETDFVLVMTVHPGFAGQKIVEEAVAKIAVLHRYREEKRLSFQIEVDGGIKAENAHLVREAGADIIVAGSGLFSTKDYAKTISLLRGN